MSAEPGDPSGPDLLVVGDWLVAGGDERRTVDGPVGVLVDAGRVVAVGAPGALRARRPRREIGGPGAGILPGFVNSHHHQSVSPFQRGVRDDALEPWLAAQVGLPLLDPVLDAHWGAIEMLRAGITTVVHNHAAAWLPREDPVGAARAIVETYDAIGMRVAFSVSARDQHPLVYGDGPGCGDAWPGAGGAAFDASTYPDLVRALAELPSASRRSRQSVQVSVHNVQWCSDELLRTARALASEIGTGIHLHLQETRLQLEYGRRRWGRSPLQHLDAIGLLGPDVTCAHAVWLAPGDPELLAARGVTVVHNPSSNVRLRSGIAPVPDLIAAGVTVSLGLDQAGIGDDQDVFTEMRLAAGLAGVTAGVPPTAGDVYAMATVGGASSTGFRDAGRLAVGDAADLVVVDLDRATAPWIHPEVDPIELVVRRVRAADVSSVVVDGVVRVHDGRIEGIDVAGVRAALAERMARDAGRHDLAAGRRLAEEVRAWFARWSEGASGTPAGATDAP